MKLVINYDFFNAIRDVNEPLTPMKIVRTHKITYVSFGALEVALCMAKKLHLHIQC